MNPDTVKAPVPVIVIAWLALIGGLLGLLTGTLFALIFDGIGLNLPIIIGILVPVVLIAVSFGLRKMKLWALYAFIAAGLLNIYLEVSSYATNWITVGLLIIAMVYLLSTRSKFV